MPPLKKKPLEKDIQATICEYLELKGIFFWRQNTAPSIYKHGDSFSFRRMGKYAKKGIPDIILIHEGEVKFIEVKRKGAKQSPEQLEFEKVCKSHGIKYILAHSVDEAMNGL